jgi:hypothetical protein
VSTWRVILRGVPSYNVEASYVDETGTDDFVLLVDEDAEGAEAIRAYINKRDVVMIVRSHEPPS